jgi:hypothetical protein
MAITFTKKTITYYGLGCAVDPDPRSLQSFQRPYSEQMIAEGKTDGNYDQINDYTAVRLWVDEASAQGWAKFMEDVAKETGRTDITVTIEDI